MADGGNGIDGDGGGDQPALLRFALLPAAGAAAAGGAGAAAELERCFEPAVAALLGCPRDRVYWVEQEGTHIDFCIYAADDDDGGGCSGSGGGDAPPSCAELAGLLLAHAAPGDALAAAEPAGPIARLRGEARPLIGRPHIGRCPDSRCTLRQGRRWSCWTRTTKSTARRRRN